VAASHKSSERPGELRRPHSAGFTLVEVLAALVIVSLGMLGVIQAVSQTANNGAYLRDRTIAHWIAMNRVTEVRLEPQAPTVGTDSDEVEMAGRKWRWSMEVTQTAVESIRRIDVNVALAENKDKTLAFVSGFYGTAVDQPGSTSMLWPGGEMPGGTGGPDGTPGDPNNPNPNPNPEDPNSPPDPGNQPQPTPDPNDPGNPAPGGESPPRTEPDPGSEQ
jgi:general secretion pathway protein I